MISVTLLRKSLEFDLRILRIAAKPLWWRIEFLLKKYTALPRILFGVASFNVPPLHLKIRTVSELGTLQSSIVDFYDDVVSHCVLGHAPVIIDAGANIGQFVNAAKLFYPAARVICFEPDPDTFADLKVNTATLTATELHNIGLGSIARNLTFYRHELSSMSSFKFEPEANERSRGATELPVSRLDDVIDSAVRPDLLKIDVEGFEQQVLEGGWDTMSRSRYLLLEVRLSPNERIDDNQLIREIRERAPSASVIRFGRPLGEAQRPIAQDVVMSLQPVASPASKP